MLNFNQFEKEILRQLLTESKNYHLGINLYEFFKKTTLVDRAIIVPPIDKSKQITFYFNNNNDIDAPKEIINFLNLIDYLNEKRLVIKVFNDCRKEDLDFISYNLFRNERLSIIPNKEKGISKYLPNFSLTALGSYNQKIRSIYQQDVLLTSDLINLIENNFETIEAKQLKEANIQSRYAIYTFVVSVIILCISLFPSIITLINSLFSLFFQ